MGLTYSKFAKSGSLSSLVKKGGDGSRIRSFPKRSSSPFKNSSQSRIATHEFPVQSEENGENGSDSTASTQPYTTLDDIDTSLSKRLQQIGPVQTPKVPAIPPSSHLRSPNLSLSDRSPLNPTYNVSMSLPIVGKTKNFDKFTTPTSNAAISLLKARSHYSDEAEAEFANLGKKGYKRRRYLDIDMVRQVLIMRQANGGLADEEIESRLGLSAGVISLLGKTGVVGVVE